MKTKLIKHYVLLILLLPFFVKAQKATWQKTSDGRWLLSEKLISNPSGAVTKDNNLPGLSELAIGSIYYVRDAEPWSGASNNRLLLDEVFGSGNYKVTTYGIDPNTLFSSGTSIVYL